MSQTYVYNSRIKRFMPINYLTDLSGIIKQNSFIGFLLIIILFGLSGIPPSSVFFVKLGILENIDNSLLLMILVFLNGLSIIYYVVLMKIIIIEKSVKRIYTYVNYNIDMMSLIVVVFGFVFLIGIFLPYI
jgi:NADH:ubiquinone oxidoreductase subunit 2 (subunit N)